MDAADAPLVFEGIAAGKLPALAGLLERGAGAKLSSQTYYGPEAAWPTVVTGCMPGKHGAYNYRCIRPGTNDLVSAPTRTYRKPFWALLPDLGASRRLLVADMRCATRLRRDDSTEVLGWGERGARRHESWPESLLARLTAEHGAYPRDLDREHAGRHRIAAAQLRTLKRMSAVRTRILGQLMREHDWELCLAAYFESHYAGHSFHRYLVPGSWGYDPSGARRFGDALLEIYRALDRGLGELIRAAGDQTNVIVFSAFGMRPNTNGERVLGELMVKLGYQVPTAPPGGTRRVELLRRAVRAAVPWPIRRRLRARLPEPVVGSHLERVWRESTDWSLTSAYPEGEPGHSFVRFNGPGTRDGAGLGEEIAAELRLLENADTGEPAVERVTPRDAVAPGPHADSLPDLSISWARSAILRRVRHPRVGVIEDDLTGLQRSEHTDEGFVIAAGPAIRARSDPVEGHVVDLAPTVLHLVGAAIPKEMDGAPLEGLLAPELGAPTRVEVDMGDDPWDAR
jgi:predicted AlkP superfamily phosphohydrolase/phosphomutase